jgi:hypothetical protein
MLFFWCEPTDSFEADTNNKLVFTIRGAPIALRRPGVRRGYAPMAARAGRGFGWGFGRPMYNPSQPKLNQFRSLLEGLISPRLPPLFSLSF